MISIADANPGHSSVSPGLPTFVTVCACDCAESFMLPRIVNCPKSLVLNCVPMSHTRIFRGFEEKLSLVSIQTPKGMSVQIFKICLIFSYKN